MPTVPSNDRTLPISAPPSGFPERQPRSGQLNMMPGALMPNHSATGDPAQLAAALGGAARPMTFQPPMNHTAMLLDPFPSSVQHTGAHMPQSRSQTPQNGSHAQRAPATNGSPSAPADSGDDQDFNRICHVVNHRKTFLPELKKILKAANLRQDGIKQQKIQRIVELATAYKSIGDKAKLAELRKIVDDVAASSIQTAGRPIRVSSGRSHVSTPFIHRSSTGATMSANIAARNMRRPTSIGEIPINTAYSGSNPLDPTTTSFKKSPFYTLTSEVRSPIFFMSPYHSRKITEKVAFTVDALTLGTHHIFLACQELKPRSSEPQPMFFPFYNEIELDNRLLQTNTRGVKGIPGSAQPVDLSPFLADARERPATKRRHQHSLKISVIISDQVEKMSEQSYKFILYYGKTHDDKELLEALQERDHITTDETRRLAAKNAIPDDEDITSSDAVLSLNDKVMLTRIQVPIRSRECSHIDCFDAETFLMLQRQAETWKCPVCNNFISWSKLAVDDFFVEILNKAGPDAESVVIKPDGSWQIETVSEDNMDDSDSEDDWFAQREKKQRKKLEEDVINLISDDEEDQPQQSVPQQSEPQQAGSRPQQAGGEPQQARGEPQQARGEPQQARGEPQQAGEPEREANGAPEREPERGHVLSTQEQDCVVWTPQASPGVQTTRLSSIFGQSHSIVFDNVDYEPASVQQASPPSKPPEVLLTVSRPPSRSPHDQSTETSAESVVIDLTAD